MCPFDAIWIWVIHKFHSDTISPSPAASPRSFLCCRRRRMRVVYSARWDISCWLRSPLDASGHHNLKSGEEIKHLRRLAAGWRTGTGGDVVSWQQKSGSCWVLGDTWSGVDLRRNHAGVRAALLHKCSVSALSLAKAEPSSIGRIKLPGFSSSRVLTQSAYIFIYLFIYLL